VRSLTARADRYGVRSSPCAALLRWRPKNLPRQRFSPGVGVRLSIVKKVYQSLGVTRRLSAQDDREAHATQLYQEAAEIPRRGLDRARARQQKASRRDSIEAEANTHGATDE